MQAEIHAGEIRRGACGKKVREMQDRTGSTCVARIVLATAASLAGVKRERDRIIEKRETIRNAKADSNYLKNCVKKVQREAEERRRALRGLP